MSVGFEDSEDFDPQAIQVAHLANMYVQQLTEKYGGYNGWVRQVGKPEPGVWLTQSELNDLYSGYRRLDLDQRVRAFISWAGLVVPKSFTERDGKLTLNLNNWGGFHRPEWAVFHLLALEHIHEDRSAWK